MPSVGLRGYIHCIFNATTAQGTDTISPVLQVRTLGPWGPATCPGSQLVSNRAGLATRSVCTPTKPRHSSAVLWGNKGLTSIQPLSASASATSRLGPLPAASPSL